jgi:hypothetical protein
VILGSVYYPSIAQWIVQVIILDTFTEKVVGRTYGEIDYMGAEGIKQGCDLAVQHLVPR